MACWDTLLDYMAHDVFISYSASDKTVADAICNTLENRKIRCWIAPRDVLPGVPYPKAIMDAINISRVFVLIYSSSSLSSKDVESEVGRAYKKGIPILPFRIEDVPMTDVMDYYIGNVHWLDAMTPPMERHIQLLADKIRVHLVDVNADSINTKALDGVVSQKNPDTPDTIASTNEKIEPEVTTKNRVLNRSSNYRQYLRTATIVGVFFGIVFFLKSLFFGLWLYDIMMAHGQTGDFLWYTVSEAFLFLCAGVAIMLASYKGLKKLGDAAIMAFYGGLIVGLTVALTNVALFILTGGWNTSKSLNQVVDMGGMITFIASEYVPSYTLLDAIVHGFITIISFTAIIGVLGFVYWIYRRFSLSLNNSISSIEQK